LIGAPSADVMESPQFLQCLDVPKSVYLEINWTFYLDVNKSICLEVNKSIYLKVDKSICLEVI